jgi:hypothetical protein
MPRFLDLRTACTVALPCCLSLALSTFGSASGSALPSILGVSRGPAADSCAPSQRRDALRAMQAAVLAAAPDRIASMTKALAPGGPLAGWRLAHGHVVLSTAGAIGVDNLEAREPLPPLLLYAPSETSAPADWLDFDGPDDPYRLVGWGYLAPYAPSSTPPQRPCIEANEWLVHEAGWHLLDGGMHLTPGATTEPPRPPGLKILMWHPRVWALHAWRGGDGVPSTAFANPGRKKGGLDLPADAFFRMVNGRRVRPPSS